METWEAIRSRRNVRQYLERTIPEDGMEQILEAARRTPSSNNKQRWDFVVVSDRKQLERLSRVWRGASHVARSAATIALIAPIAEDPGDRESIQYDLGQATMSIMLAAADLGVASGHAAVRDQDLARAILGFPDDRFCAWLIALGYPADGALDSVAGPDRKPFEDVVHVGSW